MRSFEDGQGRVWDVVLGRESWGRIVAILFVRDGGGQLMEAPLDAVGYEEAARELEEMDSEGLRALLAAALPKEIA